MPLRYRQTSVRLESLGPFRTRAEGRARAARRMAYRKLVHDLRNPINGILLTAQLLEETGGTPETERMARRLQRQCQILMDILDRGETDLG
ncbi:MAG TPA: histidine kinase dimerization/phospho-acceptor domain-containing protein [Holophaga sp.]|nr:histidine kinase dimerization/phospho-acceptor domain-containing protein [Holophaga sp.]